MSEAKRSMSDALQSAIGRLPIAVVTFDSTGAIRTINGAATTLFERERIARDLYRNQPSHPLSMLLREIITGEAPSEARTLSFSSGRRFEVEASTRSDRGADRLIMLLFREVTSAGEEGRFDLWELTPRERDVVRKLVAGRSTPEIAEELHVSVETVKSHLGKIFIKTDSRNRAELLAKTMARSPRE